MRMFAAALMGVSLAAAAQADGLKVTGQVRNPTTYSIDQLRALPNATVQWSTRSGANSHTAFYEGPLLWDLLKAAEPIDATGEGAAGRSHLQHVVIARGADGYAVAIAIGEVDPEFEEKKIVISLPRPGQVSLQLAVTGDGRAGRGVRELTELEVR